MSNLKEIRLRRKTIQATRKITSAMKMIAAAKLKKSQDKVQGARPYARLMETMLTDVVNHGDQMKEALPLLEGTGGDDIHLIVILTSDRGLCGGFNTAAVRQTRKLARYELNAGRKVRLLCIGQKGYEQLRSEFGSMIIDTISASGSPRFQDAVRISKLIQNMLEKKEFDVCTLVYTRFISALSNQVTTHRLIPFTPLTEENQGIPKKTISPETVFASSSLYEYEPTKEAVLADILPRNLRVQIFQSLLETAASEHGARMTAMDSATRNADDMISKLNLLYNRTRQGQITRELIEIISGAETL